MDSRRAEITPIQSYTNLSKFPGRRQQLDEGPPITPTRNNGGPGLRTTTTVTTTSDEGKKLLIDQFYNAVNEHAGSPSVTSPGSGNDLGPLGGGTGAVGGVTNGSINLTLPTWLLSGQGIQPTSRDKLPLEPFLENSLRELLRKGGATYISLDEKLFNDEDLESYLLNIDGIIGDMYEPGQAPLIPLARVVEDLSGSLIDNVHNQFEDCKKNSNTNHPTKQQVRRLKEYVEKLQKGAKSLSTELAKDWEPTRLRYQQQVNQNVDKLEELATTLDGLEQRLNTLKQLISKSKQTMARAITEKLELLEEVDRRMTAYARGKKERRVKILGTMAAGMVVAIAILVAVKLRSS